MEDAIRRLQGWILEYVKNRDMYTRSIRDISEMDGRLEITYKNDKGLFLVMPMLKAEHLSLISDACGKGFAKVNVVCCNTKTNLEFLIKNWANLAQKQGVYFFFANPDSQTDRRWIICPHVHNKVSDEESLSMGLAAMFDTVEECPS